MQDKRRNPVIVGNFPTTPRVLETDGGDRCENIDPLRRNAETENGVRVRQFNRLLYPTLGDSEQTERFPHPFRIFASWTHPNIQIARRSGIAIGSEGIRANHEVINFRVVQRG